MIEFENRVEIKRPVKDVYAFLADLENLPKWNYFVSNVSKTSPGAPEVGSTYHQVRKTDQQDLRIVDLEEDRSLTVETIPPSRPQLHRNMALSARPGSTLLVDHCKLESRLPGPLQLLGKARVRSAVRENLGKLKQLLETGGVTLQDGRRTRSSRRSRPTTAW